MADWTQFRQAEPQLRSSCELCEAMVPDAVDDLLSASERRWFEEHVLHCAACGELWADSQRGAAWMGVLSTHSPEPSPALLGRILAQTSLAGSPGEAATQRGETPEIESTARGLQLVPAAEPGRRVPERARVLPFRAPVPQPAYVGMHPRLMMTAAMAFFSLMLTANMLGLQPGDLRPGHFGAAARRTLADASTSAIRAFQNNKVVYQVESRLDNAQRGGPSQ